ncbi:2375_t:CDS:2, partial [Gigaspora margarita]
TYRNIFASSEAEIQQQLQIVAQNISPKDHNIAKWLGLSNQVFAVCLIRNIMETYDKIEYKIKKKIEIAKSVELAKQDDLTERIIANIKQMEVHSKMEVDINIDNKTEIIDKTSNEFDKVEDISSSIWASVSKSSQIYSPVTEVQKNWYDSTLDLVELEKWQNMLKEVKAELVV